MLLIGMLKVIAGFLIGVNVGRYCGKNELSPFLGMSLTVVLTIAICVLLDKAFA